MAINERKQSLLGPRTASCRPVRFLFLNCEPSLSLRLVTANRERHNSEEPEDNNLPDAYH
jgi:hypothetical protein